MQAIKKALHNFSVFSGLVVNTEKSNVYGTKAAQDIHQIQEVWGCTSKPLTLSNLGLLISGKRKNIGMCHFNRVSGEYFGQMER